jgi:uncharacterized sodium:solute symporter family permease YidK
VLPSTLRGRFLAVLLGVVLPSLTLFGVLHHDMVKRALLNEVDQSLSRRASEVTELLRRNRVMSTADLARFQLVSAPLLVTSTPEVYLDLGESGRLQHPR